MLSRPSAFRRLLTTAATLAAITAAPAGALAAEIIDLTIDFARILKIEQPAKTILIGNPGIADTTFRRDDPRSLILTGKAAGTTNLIVLDKDGAEVLNATLRVSSDIQQLTTVFYGSRRQTFSCAPVCEQVISVGDDNEKFDAAREQIQNRQQFSQTQ